MATSIPIPNNPRSEDLWKGIGGHFDSFGQILCEFIDNSISNFKGNSLISKTILITLTEKQGSVEVEIEDSGTGIKNLTVAFSLGNTSAGESTLNEHGFGMKHAFASANPTNDSWSVYTRTKEDFDAKRFTKIQAPYTIEDFSGVALTLDDEDGNWPGQLNSSGTYIKFECSRDLFNTIRKGITEANLPGNISHFSTFVRILREDLGFVYAGVIQKNQATISLISNGLDREDSDIPVSVEAVVPNWDNYYRPGSGEVERDLGGGRVKLRYSFGAIKQSEYKRYYRQNTATSGLEIRLNGRVIIYNLFEEVWHRQPHNDYNHLLVTVDVISNNRDSLPSTRTSKNGLRQGDPRYASILSWVLEMMPTPPKEIDGGTDEVSLFEELERIRLNTLPDPKTITREQIVFNAIRERVRIDLYQKFQEDVTIFEGKKDKTTVKDVYQLRMYWDGCTVDAIQPTEAVLVAAVHPNSVLALVSYINQMKDVNGNNYNFITKTWKDLSVNYPR